jgi:hypothetical protein
MRVTKWVSAEAEVEIDVDIQDITAELRIDAERCNGAEVKRGIANCVNFLRSIPDDLIAADKPETRKLISDHLQEQANRFKV